MITLTPFERMVRATLIASIRASGGNPATATITEQDLDAQLGDRRREDDPTLSWPKTGFFEALAHVSMFEAQHGRPLVTALVVTSETHRPGGGFWRLARQLELDVDDEDAFWVDEVLALVDLWGSGVQDPLPSVVDVVDAALDVIDGRLRALDRVIRRGTRLPHLVTTFFWPPDRSRADAWDYSLQIANVGPAPAINALWVGTGTYTPYLATTLLHLSPGDQRTVRLRKIRITTDQGAMGPPVDGIVELLLCGDGTGRLLRFRPRLAQRPDVWLEDPRAKPPEWVAWYRNLLNDLPSYEDALMPGTARLTAVDR
jgi:hypothetical protein